MFTRPDEISDDDVARTLLNGWGLDVDEISYAAVGFGSHHWRATSPDARWFVTVDDLEMLRRDANVDRGAALDRLAVALAAAGNLRSAGCLFIVSAVRSQRGNLLEPIDDRFVCAVYPHVDGVAGDFGHYANNGERMAVVDVLVELHTRSADGSVSALADDHSIPSRDELQRAMADLASQWPTGPFGEAARELVRRHEPGLRSVLAVYDRLVESVAERRPSRVVTHGEPHRGNVIFTVNGPMLIDWDTTLQAPPERDLWSLIAEDASVRDHYEARAGRRLDDDILTLYRLWWDLCEIALYVADFRRPHTRTADTETAWRGLTEHLDPSRWTDVLGR